MQVWGKMFDQLSILSCPPHICIFCEGIALGPCTLNFEDSKLIAISYCLLKAFGVALGSSKKMCVAEMLMWRVPPILVLLHLHLLYVGKLKSDQDRIFFESKT